jgi:hypothetical protein
MFERRMAHQEALAELHGKIEAQRVLTEILLNEMVGRSSDPEQAVSDCERMMGLKPADAPPSTMHDAMRKHLSETVRRLRANLLR